MMKSKNTGKQKCPRFLHGKTTAGYSLVMAVTMSALLLYTGLAFLKWQNASLVNGRRRVAEMQAFYTAQAAVIAHPISFLRGMRLRDSFFPSVYHFNNGIIPNMGKYEDARIERNPSGSYPAIVGSSRTEYLCSAVGIAEYRDNNGKLQCVKRRVKIRVKLTQFSDYLYYSDSELTRNGEFQYFEGGDFLYGKVHSNSHIGMRPGAYFGGFVTSGGRLRDTLGVHFAAKPIPGYREMVLRAKMPRIAWSLRQAAAAGGTWLDTRNREETYGLRFRGSAADVWIWRTGTTSPFMVEPPVSTITLPSVQNYPIFCDGDLWIQGNITGRVGIGAEGSIRLMDNLVLTDAMTWPYIISPSSSNNITVISEAQHGQTRFDPLTGILIANTYANGRGDGGNHFSVSVGSQNRRDIALHGSYISLNSSVTFQQQNSDEGDESYVYQCPDHGTDERGIIYLHGSLTQRRAESFHTNNSQTTQISTGYRLLFRYDRRYSWNPPPFTDLFPESGDNNLSIGLWEDDAPRALQQGYTYEWSDPPPE
ncbi:MAG: DUF4900 domain-containing protein [bacterium]|nr:DUF4900 domain-containing protein [bacterium]